MSFNCSYCNCRHDKHRKLYKSTNEALDACLKLIDGNGGTFPDLLEQKTQTQIHSVIQQMKVQIKGLPRSKSHHPAEQMYSHRRI